MASPSEYIQDNWKTVVGGIAAVILLSVLLGSGNFSGVLPGGQFECGEAAEFDLNGDGQGTTYETVAELQQAFETNGLDWEDFDERFNPHVEEGVVVVGGEACEDETQ